MDPAELQRQARAEEEKHRLTANGDARNKPDEPLTPLIPACLKGSDWLQRDLPEPDFMLANLLSTTSRMELIGPTGLGKTNFALALSNAIAYGDPFPHWGTARGRDAFSTSMARCPIAK
jgi:hypothetical protein